MNGVAFHGSFKLKGRRVKPKGRSGGHQKQYQSSMTAQMHGEKVQRKYKYKCQEYSRELCEN